jgi:hypothetical protein
MSILHPLELVNNRLPFWIVGKGLQIFNRGLLKYTFWLLEGPVTIIAIELAISDSGAKRLKRLPIPRPEMLRPDGKVGASGRSSMTSFLGKRQTTNLFALPSSLRIV